MIEIPDEKKYELAKQARKNRALAALLGLFLSPFGYLYVNEGGWALFNFLTFNYLLFGFIIVPLHSVSKIETARSELNEAGVDWRK